MVNGVNFPQHYFRAGLPVSPRLPVLALVVFHFAAIHAVSQYPGRITKDAKDTPALRAVAVLEWTGDIRKPKACRIVPVSIYDGQQLQDAGLYLARPEPMAVAREVEYQLKLNGKTVGLFDIKGSGQEQGSWVGYGNWKALPAPKPAPAKIAPVDAANDQDDDKPVLHRKHPSADSPGNTSPSGDSASNAPAPDSDRPTLHKKNTSDSTDSSATSDPDRPTLHRNPATSSDSPSAGAPADPDRPVLKRPTSVSSEDVGNVDSVAGTDPDRPRIHRGKSAGSTAEVLPTLMGLPQDMQQAVAVSDPRTRPDHAWDFSWSNPEDKEKMKSQLEDLAREFLGLTSPAPAPAKATAHRTATAKKAAPTAAPVEPATLEDEEFRVFELAYGSGATLVLTAHTSGPAAQQKFVTLIAQPDLYGNVLVVFKNVTDGSHLDQIPRMRLVDAVDALADNRGELLFELRGDTSRQFALFRVMRGSAERLFVSSGGNFGSATSE